MKKGIIYTSLLTALSVNTFAGCIGTDSFYTCTESNGNTYNVTKIGDQTFTNGYNSNTGSSWSQNSNTIGNTTYQNGYDSDGNSWNQTINKIGNTTTYSGTDSDGNYFYKSCNQYGCN